MHARLVEDVEAVNPILAVYADWLEARCMRSGESFRDEALAALPPFVSSTGEGIGDLDGDGGGDGIGWSYGDGSGNGVGRGIGLISHDDRFLAGDGTGHGDRITTSGPNGWGYGGEDLA